MLNTLKVLKNTIFWDVMPYSLLEINIWKELAAFTSRWTTPHHIPPWMLL